VFIDAVTATGFASLGEAKKCVGQHGQHRSLSRNSSSRAYWKSTFGLIAGGRFAGDLTKRSSGFFPITYRCSSPKRNRATGQA
jgi:hypothetical protein